MKAEKERERTKKISVHKSGIAGRGIFAGEDIKKREFIFTAGDHWKFLVFFNHSCRPNAKLIMRNNKAVCDQFCALRHIKAGEEITFDYRKTRWSHYYDEMMEEKNGCFCGKCK